MISLHRRMARAICAFPQCMMFQCLMTSSSFGRVFSLHRRRARAMFAFQGGMRCDDQTPNPEPLAPRLTQVPPRPSKVAPRWPRLCPIWLRFAPNLQTQSVPSSPRHQTKSMVFLRFDNQFWLTPIYIVARVLALNSDFAAQA